MENRPTGRQKHVTEGGKGVQKKGEGLGTGPVGRADGYAGRKAQQTVGASSGGRGQGNAEAGPGSSQRGSGGGGRSPLMLIIALVIALLGGGGGLTALLNGGSDSSSDGISTYTYSNGSLTGSTGGSSYSGGSTGGSSYAGGSTGGSSYAGGSTGGSSYAGSSAGGSSYTGSSASGSASNGSGSSGYTSDYTSGYSFGDLFSGSYQSSASDYTQEYDAGTGSSGGFFDLSSIFGGGLTSSALGTNGSWTNAANTGLLNTSVAEGSRAKFTKLKGNGRDTVTLMVYMCGTDLESGSGMATSDLVEMTKAGLSDQVKILVYTGGCSRWKNNIISSSRNQIYEVKNGGLSLLVEDDGDRAMTDPDTLSRFLQWGKKNYPATRYQLIFWDHGGGSASGYGYDQKHSRSGSMSLAQIRRAVGESGIQFDFIGFDACLMATAENALGLADYADYLIASEETEPGIGWYYTNWLTQLSENTSLPTIEVGRKIVDDFTKMCAQKCPGQSTTLSVVDLAELQHTLPDSFREFSRETGEMIEEASFGKVATARAQTREFARSNGINQVDLTDLAFRVGTEEGNQLAKTLISAVKYNQTSRDMTNSFGLSIFFPNKNISKVSSMAQTYEQVGLDPDCMVKFATVQASGQTVTGGSHSAFGSLSGSGYDSYDTDMLGSLINSLFGGSSGSSASGSSVYGGSSSYGGSSYGGSAYGGSSYGGGSYGSSAYGGSSYGGSSYAGSSYGSGSFGSSSMMDIVGALLGNTTGRSMFFGEDTDLSFLDESGLSAGQVVSILSQNQFDTAALVWQDNAVNHTMHLTEDQWAQVQRLQVNLFYDDGEGFVDLGLDDTCTFTQEKDLVGETDRTWISVDGQPVAYYNIGTFGEGEDAATLGRIPCKVNGEFANLMVVFDNEHPYGFIAGLRTDYREGETDTLAKSMTSLQTGDIVVFLCDYYSYEGDYQDSYQLGDELLVTDPDAIEISNTDVGEGGAVVTYCFTDLYGQEYWTPPIRQ